MANASLLRNYLCKPNEHNLKFVKYSEPEMERRGGKGLFGIFGKY